MACPRPDPQNLEPAAEKPGEETEAPPNPFPTQSSLRSSGEIADESNFLTSISVGVTVSLAGRKATSL